MKPAEKKTIFNSRSRRKELIFYVCLIGIPFAQFLIMYVFVNLRSFAFIFQEYDAASGKYLFDGGALFRNFRALVVDMVAKGQLLPSVVNSLISYAVSLAVVTPLTVIVSFFIYKKLPLAGYFRIVLYLPNIVASMATVLGFKIFVGKGLPAIFPNQEIFTKYGGLLSNPDTIFPMLVFYAAWVGLGTSLVMMTGVMSRVSAELLESAKIDGANLFHEFFHIVWPVIYPVLTIQIYTGVVAIFSGGPPTYMFYGNGDRGQYATTFGYYFFTMVVGGSGSSQLANYPRAAAGGLLFTMISAPLVFLLKSFFEKRDPNEEYVPKRRLKRALEASRR